MAGFSSASGASYGTTTTSQQPQHPVGMFGTVQRPKYTPYTQKQRSSELPPFSGIQRRRKRGDVLAKWTTRGVLLAPLVILVVWSIAVISSGGQKRIARSNQQMNSNPAKLPYTMTTGANAMGSTAIGMQQQLTMAQTVKQQAKKKKKNRYGTTNTNVHIRPRPHPRAVQQQRGGDMIPVYVPLGEQQQQQQSVQQQQQVQLVPQQQSVQQQSSMGVASNNVQPAVLIGDGMGASATTGNRMANANNMMAVSQTNANNMMATASQGNMMADSQANNGNGMMATASQASGNLMAATAQSGANNMMATASQGNMMADSQANNGNGMMATASQASGNLMAATAQNGANNMMATASQSNMMAASQTDGNGMTATASQAAGNNMMAASQTNNAMASTIQDANVDTASQVTPPPRTRRKQQQSSTGPKILYYDASTMDGDHLVIPTTVYDSSGKAVDVASLQASNTEIYMEPPAAQSAQEEQQNQRQLSMPSYNSYSEASPQDQYIVVATVAVMALLVGALSARRMRSRQFLASCIENESLEDEVAYDTAYTTSQQHAYDTFGPWRGDLEKFDV